MKRFCFITLFIIFCAATWAQELPVNTEQQLENLTEILEGDIEDESMLQQLNWFREHPLNINQATAEELRQLRFLTDLQIDNLLRYRRLVGAFIDLYELQAVPALDVQTIRRILPFITLSEDANIARNLLQRMKGGEHSFLLRNSRILEKQKGYKEDATTRYAGSPDHLLFRYRYRFKNLLQFGITGDKDAGEQFFKGSQSKGFDFYSFHVFARRLGLFKSLALGDFAVNMGQGLIQWQSLAFKKGEDVINIKRQAPVLNPYSSAGEFYFNRGAGFTIKKKSVEATLFAGYKKISGNILVDTVFGDETFSSLQVSGLHRTPSEIADKNAIGQVSWGGSINWQSSMLKIGLNTVHYQFSKSLQKERVPYNYFAIEGKNWGNYSLDYSLTWKNLHVFGEAALDKNFSKAFMSGILLSADPKIDVSLLYRDISPKYQSLYGNAFTEGVSPTNEKGFYTGLSVRPAPKWRIDGYMDFYRFPWLRYRVDAPSYGHDFMAQINYQPTKTVSVYTRFRKESKSLNESSDSITRSVSAIPKQNWRLQMDYGLSPSVSLRSRVDLMWYDRQGISSENGFLYFVEGFYNAKQSVSGSLRLQWFETDGFNSRIYAFERDVLYNYSVPGFFDKGLRYYLNVNIDVRKDISLWLKWAQTIYRDRQAIGSELDIIEGNRRSEIKFQVRYIL